MSKYIWDLKDEGRTANVKYEMLHKVKGKPRVNYCRLCSTEKLEIINNLDDSQCLNKRSEFISKCRHVNKYAITTAKD